MPNGQQVAAQQGMNMGIQNDGVPNPNWRDELSQNDRNQFIAQL